MPAPSSLKVTHQLRLALIAPEALAATKLAIKRAADTAGLRTAMRAGTDRGRATRRGDYRDGRRIPRALAEDGLGGEH